MSSASWRTPVTSQRMILSLLLINDLNIFWLQNQLVKIWKSSNIDPLPLHWHLFVLKGVIALMRIGYLYNYMQTPFTLLQAAKKQLRQSLSKAISPQKYSFSVQNQGRNEVASPARKRNKSNDTKVSYNPRKLMNQSKRGFQNERKDVFQKLNQDKLHQEFKSKIINAIKEEKYHITIKDSRKEVADDDKIVFTKQQFLRTHGGFKGKYQQNNVWTDTSKSKMIHATRNQNRRASIMIKIKKSRYIRETGSPQFIVQKCKLHQYRLQQQRRVDQLERPHYFQECECQRAHRLQIQRAYTAQRPSTQSHSVKFNSMKTIAVKMQEEDPPKDVHFLQCKQIINEKDAIRGTNDTDKDSLQISLNKNTIVSFIRQSKNARAKAKAFQNQLKHQRDQSSPQIIHSNTDNPEFHICTCKYKDNSPKIRRRSPLKKSIDRKTIQQKSTQKRWIGQGVFLNGWQTGNFQQIDDML